MVAAWLPVFVFFAQGFEHLVVNFFVIPAGMMMGAKVTIIDWLVLERHSRRLYRRISSAEFLFTGLAIYWTFRPASERAVARPVAAAALRSERAVAASPRGEKSAPRDLGREAKITANSMIFSMVGAQGLEPWTR